MNEQQQLLRELSSYQLEPYIQQYQTQYPEFALHLKQAQQASLSGVHRVHLISYTYDGALIEELFTRDGIGTLITDAHYEEVRIANIHDVGGLIGGHVHSNKGRYFSLSFT